MQVHVGLMIMYNIRYMHAAPANAGGLIGYLLYSAWTLETPPIYNHMETKNNYQCIASPILLMLVIQLIDQLY